MEEDSNVNCVPDEIMSRGDHSDEFTRKNPINNSPRRERVLQITRGNTHDIQSLENKFN